MPSPLPLAEYRGEMNYDVDLFVIGGGSGGVRAARVAAGHGARVMLAEEFRLGGTCVIRGCVPKKLFVYAARFKSMFDDAVSFGWTAPGAHFDWHSLVATKDRETHRLESLYGKAQIEAGVQVVKSRAVIDSEHTVRLLVDGRRVRARHILIATGAKPQLGRIPGADLAITSDQIFDLPNFPSRLVIAGAGYIAIELAGLFASLGSKVAIVCRRDNVLQGFDEDLREALCNAYERSGIQLVFNDTLMRIERGSSMGSLTATTLGGISLDADQVLMAIGREPNSAGLGLEAIGVERKTNGAIVVDGHARTNVPGIHAIGDVTDRINLTPVALREGHAFADRLFGSEPWDVDYALIPTAIFSSPEVGTVGMTERQARSAFDSVAIYRTSFRALKEMATGRQQHTLMKVIVDQTSDRILGVHLFAEEASELIQLIAVAVRAGATMRQFLTTMAVHPTLGEELVTLRAPVEIHNRRCE